MNIKVLKLYPNTSKIIDLAPLEESYKSGRLQDADIFAILFKIIENPNFKQSEEDYIDLNCFQIHEHEWNLLFGFIKNGQLPYKETSTELYDLNKCYNITLKLGGIPAFDKFYKSQINNYKKSIVQYYNPMTPEKDINNEYEWQTINTMARCVIYKNDESVTIPINEKSSVMYIRKLKSSSSSNQPSGTLD
tara:strand:- start:184 stop:756 length:573 start_codon:yes stop_codon:yes gene_type:complete